MAALTDKLRKVGVAGNLTTLAAPGKALGASSINIGSATNWPTDTAVTLTIRTVDSDGALVPGTQTVWIGTVSGTTVTIDPTPVYGADQVYAAGSSTQVYIGLSADNHNDLIDALLNVLDQDGTMKAGAVDNAAALASGVVTTVKIADSAVDATKLALGVPVQMVSAASGSFATGTTIIPADATTPQNTEGTEFMTLAITPKSATNILVIEVNALLAAGAGANNYVGAIFQDSTAGALAADSVGQTNTNVPMPLVVRHRMVAGTTSETTFKFRAGPSAAATMTFNGSAGSVLYGSASKSSITITEYKAS